MEQKDDKYNRIGQILLVPNAPKIFLEKENLLLQENMATILEKHQK